MTFSVVLRVPLRSATARRREVGERAPAADGNSVFTEDEMAMEIPRKPEDIK